MLWRLSPGACIWLDWGVFSPLKNWSMTDEFCDRIKIDADIFLWNIEVVGVRPS